MPIETPQGISRCTPPMSVCSGRPCSFASQSHSAASRPPVAIWCPRMFDHRAEAPLAASSGDSSAFGIANCLRMYQAVSVDSSL